MAATGALKAPLPVVYDLDKLRAALVAEAALGLRVRLASAGRSRGVDLLLRGPGGCWQADPWRVEEVDLTGGKAEVIDVTCHSDSSKYRSFVVGDVDPGRVQLLLSLSGVKRRLRLRGEVLLRFPLWRLANEPGETSLKMAFRPLEAKWCDG
jgi:hypothetical protein